MLRDANLDTPSERRRKTRDQSGDPFWQLGKPPLFDPLFGETTEFQCLFGIRLSVSFFKVQNMGLEFHDEIT